MKILIYSIILFLNIWRLLFIPTIMYCKNTNFRVVIKSDMYRLDENYYKASILNYYYHILYNKTFRAIVSYRIRKYSVVISKIFDMFFPKKTDLELAGKIGKGLRINHGQSSVIILNKSGDNLTVYQNVTCGRNKNHINLTDDSGSNCFPTCGYNVTIYSGAVVVGGINIGNNVEIGANSVISRDVPSNAIVVGNPPIIVRLNGEKVKIGLNEV